MALGDIEISWEPPTQTVSGSPLTIEKFSIYERLPTGEVIKVRDVNDPQATETTLVDYYTETRAYEFAVSTHNSDGESALSPWGSDSVDVPQAMGVPVIRIVKKS